jgi:hypothetical protein
LDKLTYPILKYQKDDAAKLMTAIKNVMIRTPKCSEECKEGKVVMLPKPCNEEEKGKPENRRPITLSNIFYRIIFGRIAKYIQSIHRSKSEKGDGMVFKKQKGFIKNINGCCEHSARINFLITYVISNKNSLYVAALDCKDAFGSVSYQLMNINFKNLEVPTKLRNLIIHPYKGSQVRIWSAGKVSRSIYIKKGVKQNCPLSPLLFNICVDSLILFLKKSEEFGCRTAKLGETIVQAYADDMILVSDSEDNLQTLINRAKSFVDFANIRFNTKKCEVLRINPRRNDKNLSLTGLKRNM